MNRKHKIYKKEKIDISEIVCNCGDILKPIRLSENKYLFQCMGCGYSGIIKITRMKK